MQPRYPWSGALVILDEYDKKLTEKVQKLQFHPIVDFCLAPGAFVFGWKGTVVVVLPLVCLFGGQNIFFFTILSVMLGQVRSLCQVSNTADLTLCAAGQVLCRTVKKLVKRCRPDYSQHIPRAWNMYGQIRELSSDGYAFPSGDAMCGGAIAGSLAHCTEVSWWYGLVLFPAFGRVYWHYHFVGDVVCGACVGLFAATITGWVFHEQLITALHVAAAIVSFLAFMKLTASPRTHNNTLDEEHQYFKLPGT
eukprot:m.8631 g.8631  ORF g.8631 m.8631 type:complete len:250 (+) comp4082_c0_seq1:175-924(+)